MTKAYVTTGIDGLYEYDAIGNNTVYQMGNITDTMVYNHFGQIDKVTRTKSGTVSDTIDYTYDSAKGLMLSKETDEEITSYAYNSLGSVTSITSPSGLTRIYTRDSLDRISSVSADNKNFTYEYYGDGQIKKVTYPNTDITAEYTYDNANRMTSVVTKKGTSIIYNCQYTYDNANNIISVTGTETANYTYDSLNRLKTSTQNGVTTTYEYDSRNNLISETAPNFTKTYEYGGDNRLYKVCENGVDTLYEYDPNGNLIKRGNDEFAYD
ncbi:MAG: RHS repeat protein, partial [Clostridia bacterium]|nr:RHS repeat protein [Clostridia bacterium]